MGVDGSGGWQASKPRAVWVLSRGRGRVPLPAWPGILLGWKRTDPDPPSPARWMGLVAYARESGALVEVQWVYDSDLQPVAEQPPMLGG